MYSTSDIVLTTIPATQQTRHPGQVSYMSVVERTDYTVLLAWMKTSCRLPADTGTQQQASIITSSIDIQDHQRGEAQIQSSTSSAQPSPGTTLPSVTDTRPVDIVTSETFEVNLPLKNTIEASPAALQSDRRFNGFLELDEEDSFIIDRGFVRLFDEVKRVIIHKQTLIHIKGLHRCFSLWLRLIFELLAFDVSSEHDFTVRHLFFLSEDPEYKKVDVYVALNRAVMIKEMDSISDAVNFVVPFNQAIILYDKTVSRKLVKRRHLCFVLGELPTGTKGHCIDFWQPGYAMATAYPLFSDCIDLYYVGKFEDRDLSTLYHICSGNFEILDSMIASEYLLFEEATKCINYYIGSSMDTKEAVEEGNVDKIMVNIQFDEVQIPAEEEVDHVATTIILGNPTEHWPKESRKLLGTMSDSNSPGHRPILNYPKLSSTSVRSMYLLSPSQELFESAKKNHVVFEHVPFPGYLKQTDQPLLANRWHLETNPITGRVQLVTEVLFSLSTKILYAMVETLTNNLYLIKCRSWHITGIYGTGKSTSLLICQNLWFSRPSLFRVVYLPHTRMFQERSFAETLKLFVCYAFLRDPVQQKLFSIKPDNVDGLFEVLQPYLEQRALFFVIIIDQINEIWDKTDDWGNDAQKFIQSELRPSLQNGVFSRILLITAASLNNSAAPSMDQPIKDLSIDFFNGFNNFESEWMVTRYLKHRNLDLIKKINLTELLGIRPVDTDFTVNAKILKIGTKTPRPKITERTVSSRIKYLKKGIQKRFRKFAREPVESKREKYEELLNVLYSNILDDFDYDFIDRRVVKPVLCPKSWDLMRGKIIEENRLLEVLPLPISDLAGYEKWLLKPEFRAALSMDVPQHCLLPCSKVARAALHELHIERMQTAASRKLLAQSPGSAGFVFEDAFEEDILRGLMKVISAYPVCFENEETAVVGTTLEPLFKFCKTRHHIAPFELFWADDEQTMKDLKDLKGRLSSIGIEQDGLLHLFRMRRNEEAVDFCLIQNETCFLVQNGISAAPGILRKKLLVTAYVVGTKARSLLPLLYPNPQDKVKLLFVCGPDPFKKLPEKIEKKPPTKIVKSSEESKGKSPTVFGEIDTLAGKKVLRADIEKGSVADSTTDHSKWSIPKLMKEVSKLVKDGRLEVYYLAVQNHPEDCFKISGAIYAQYEHALKAVKKRR